MHVTMTPVGFKTASSHDKVRRSNTLVKSLRSLFPCNKPITTTITAPQTHSISSPTTAAEDVHLPCNLADCTSNEHGV
jgi:hypothetical protein